MLIQIFIFKCLNVGYNFNKLENSQHD